MQINGNIFMGVYNERRALQSADFKLVSEQKADSISEKAAKAIQEIKRQGSRTASISLSEDARAFLCSEEGYNKMKKDVEDLYAKNAMQQKELMKNDESDSFWSNTGNQWLVLSEKLYKNGFYTDMSDEEVEQAETTLAKITAGMDHLSRTLYQTGIEFSDYYGHGSNFFMDSNEVNLELESAAAALKYFSEKYIDKERQGEFNELIDQFYKHNTTIINGYQSPVESFNKAVNAIHNGQYANSQVNSPYNQAMKNSNSGIDASIYLGGVTHSAAEKAEYTGEIAQLFEQLGTNTDAADSIWKQIEDAFAGYATKDSDDPQIQNYVLEQSKHTINRIKGYWAELL